MYWGDGHLFVFLVMGLGFKKIQCVLLTCNDLISQYHPFEGRERRRGEKIPGDLFSHTYLFYSPHPVLQLPTRLLPGNLSHPKQKLLRQSPQNPKSKLVILFLNSPSFTNLLLVFWASYLTWGPTVLLGSCWKLKGIHKMWRVWLR